jgi:predicted alpha-1,6-mannanase (GH76 family)
MLPDIVVVTETIYETTYVEYHDSTTQSTKTKSSTEHPTTSEMIIPSSAFTSIATAAAALPTTLIKSTRSAAADAAAPSANPTYSSVVSDAISAMGNSYSTSSLQWTDVQGWTAANVYNDIMDFDFYSKTTTFQSPYGNALLQISTTPSIQGEVLSTDGFNDDQLWWCLAMLRAYQNYGHDELLNQTVKQWTAIGANAQLSTSDQGTTVNKAGLERSEPIPASCDVDGAVYWSSQPDSTLNAISTSLYAQVGAWLFELTGDETFRGPADAALGWLQRMMLSQSTGIMNIDSVSPAGCDKHFGSLTYNTGVYIGALTSFYRSTGESKYLTSALQSVTSSVTGSFGDSPPLVINQQGDITSNGDDVAWRNVLFRNIVDFYVSLVPKGSVDSGLQSQVQAFFTANYNQIQSKAKFGDLYAANWFGLIGSGSDWGTASVLSCLTGAMMIL